MTWEVFQHEFFWNAAVGGACAGILCALVGVFVVTMHLSLLGVCIAHAAFAGALMGVWLDFDPMLGAFIFSVAAAGLVGPLADRGELSPDASIGIVFSFMLGLGFLFLGMMPGSRAEALNLFWGSILTLTRGDVAVLLGTLAAAGLLLFLFGKEVHAVLCHRHVALAVGIPATAVFYGMLFSTGIVIAVSLESIGGLLIYSLVLNPAAAAYQLTYSMKRMMAYAALFGVLSCWAGLLASCLWALPAGASIVLVSSTIFGAATLLSPKRRNAARRLA